MENSVTVPEWLDDQFIEKALREGERNEKIKVRHIDASPATFACDNYCSKMLRVKVDYESNNGEVCKKSVIVKAIPDSELVKMIVVGNGLFSTEIEVLGKVIPEYHRLLDAASSGSRVTLAAKCYYHTEEPDQRLVMEDLSESGFKMAERSLGLDLEHSKLLFSRLGIFHAASVALHRQNPQSFDKLLNHPNLKNPEMMGMMIKPAFDNVAVTLQGWPELGQKYSEKLRRIGETVIQRMEKSFERNEGGFNVLNHGDAWINNIMFKYGEDGKVTDLRFVDFQLSFYGSPVIDLQYLLYSSCTSEVRSNYMDSLLECYHSSLSETLSRLGCGDQCPSLKDIYVELEARNFVAILASISLLALRFFKPSDFAQLDIKFEDIKLEDMGKFGLFKNMAEPYVKEISNTLPIFDEKGWLD